MKKLYFFLGVSVLLASCASQKYSRTDNITDDVYFSPDDIKESIQVNRVKPQDSANDGFTYDNTNATANPNAAYRSYQPDPATPSQNSTPSSNTPNYGAVQNTNYFSQSFFLNTGLGIYPSYSYWGIYGRRPFNRYSFYNYGWGLQWGNPQWGWGMGYYQPSWYYSPWNTFYSPFYDPFYDPFYNPYYFNAWNPGFGYYGYPHYHPHFINPINPGGQSSIISNGIRRRGIGTLLPNNTGGYKPGGRSPSTVTPTTPGATSAPGRDIGSPSSSPQVGGGGLSPSNGTNDRRGSGSSGSSNDPNNGSQPSVQPQSRPSSPQSRPSVPQQEPRAPSTRPSSPSTPTPQPAPPSRQPNYRPQPSPSPQPSRQPSYNPPSRPSGGSSGGSGSSPRRRR